MVTGKQDPPICLQGRPFGNLTTFASGKLFVYGQKCQKGVSFGNQGALLEELTQTETFESVRTEQNFKKRRSGNLFLCLSLVIGLWRKVDVVISILSAHWR